MLMSWVAACSLFASEDATLAGTGTGMRPSSLTGDSDRPVVEVLPPRGDDRPLLDPDADPRTPLGRLRARYLPVWTQEFDGAFPPEACGTAWELDGVAEPVSGVDISIYGDAPTMAALGVMRYEHLVSRALADPTPLAQLCVAVGSVGPARTAALESLQTALETGQPASVGSSYPSEVTLIAVGPSAALALACTQTPPQDAALGSAQAPGDDERPGMSDGGDAPPEALDDGTLPPPSPSRLGAYLLRVSRGHEDRVADTSYRVFDVDHRESPGCADWAPWLAQWESAVDAWLAEGQIWSLHGEALSTDDLCTAPPEEGPDECPADWLG